MFSPWVLLLLSILAVYVNASPLLEARKNGGANKGGPASAKVTIYSQYTCAAPNTVRTTRLSLVFTQSTDTSKLPPTDGSAGTANNFNIAEAQCTIPNTGLSFGGAITASLTAEPKTGTAGCKS